MVKVSLMPALRRRGAAITPLHPAVPRPRRATRAALVVAVALSAALPAASASAKDVPLTSSKLLWATVNICDTEAHPDTVGIRGAMPGSGRAGEKMFMRFELQYWAKAATEWRSLGAPGDSGFVPVGSARYKQRQSGRNFTVRPPATGAFVLRGVVRFEWRKGSTVVRRARRVTTAKRGATPGADPAGFSAASCTVAGP